MYKPIEVQVGGLTLVVYRARHDAGDVGFEYRCGFCRRYGVGYLDAETAVRDAHLHRCQERSWNEVDLNDPVKES